MANKKNSNDPDVDFASKHRIIRTCLTKIAIVTAMFFLTGGAVFCQDKQIKKNNPEKKTSGSYKSILIDQAKQESDTLELKMYRAIPKGGMLKHYKTLFTTIHGTEQDVKLSEAKKFAEVILDTSNNLYYGRLSNSNVLIPEATVFGWHPYWITDACNYYPYSLLTTIAFFAYDVNEKDGSCYDQDAIANWRSTPLIDSAKKHNVNVLLTITSYGRERNNEFLQDKNTEAWATLGDSLLFLLRARGAKGIDIDFTGIARAKRDNFTRFVSSLRTKIGDSCIISLHITAKDLNSGGIDLPKLKSMAKVNTFIVQGFDYENLSHVDGAMAPLYSNDPAKNCIAKTVQQCLKDSLKPQDILLNLPLFGGVSYNNEYKEMSYNDIVSIYEKNYTHQIELWSESAKISLGKNKDTIIWYESGESIHRKFRWAMEHGLQGVGLWGLGYDGGRPEVWKAVTENYGVQPVKEIFPIMIDNGKIYPFIYALQKYRKIIGVGLLILVSFFIAGLLLSLLDWRVREIFFRSYINRALLSAIIILLLIVSLYCFTADMKSENVLLPLFIGLSLGGGVVYLITKFYMTYRKKMP